jgi:hypothetical protein
MMLALEHILKRREPDSLGDDSANHATASRIISPTAELYIQKAYGVNRQGQGSARLRTCDDRASFRRTLAEPMQILAPHRLL